MIVPLEVDEWIVTVEEMAELDRNLSRIAADVYRMYTNLGEAPEMPKPTPTTATVTINNARYVLFEFMGPALATLAIVATLHALATKTATLVLEYQTFKTRRRLRTHICARICLNILDQARKDIGIMRKNALETEDTAKRTRRKFESRK